MNYVGYIMISLKIYFLINCTVISHISILSSYPWKQVTSPFPIISITICHHRCNSIHNIFLLAFFFSSLQRVNIIANELKIAFRDLSLSIRIVHPYLIFLLFNGKTVTKWLYIFIIQTWKFILLYSSFCRKCMLVYRW